MKGLLLKNFKRGTLWLPTVILGAGILTILGSGGGGGGAANKNTNEFLSTDLSFKITTNGGTVSNEPYSGYGGGAGGAVTIENGDSGSGYGGGGGDVKILKTIPAKSGFTFTLYSSSPNLGDNPVRVTTDTTFAVMSTIKEDPGADGTVYLKHDDYIGEYTATLFLSDGDGDQTNDEAATGLYVAKGVTLTLDLMDPTEWTQIMVTHDVDNRGTITTADTESGERGALYIEAVHYFGSSSIDTSGVTAGQDGGYIQIDVDTFANKGDINSFGAGDPSYYGGYGGWVGIAANTIENSGNIDASAGGGYGGFDAPNISLSANSGHLYNAGNLTTRGANSTNLYTNGSKGGVIHLTATDDFVSIGNLDASGGDATGTQAYSGYGGSVNISAKGSILLGGNMDASAGDSDSGRGRPGGTVSVSLVPTVGNSTGQSITLVGYDSIDTSGGDSQYGAGSLPTAGAITIQNTWGDDGTDTSYAGNIVNEASLIARGGSTLGTDYGYVSLPGHGGMATLKTIACEGPCVALGETYETVENAGDINTSGGNNTQSSYNAGNAAEAYIYGERGATNSGNITANGGNNSGVSAAGGGHGYIITINSAFGTATSIGTLSVDGGTGTTPGNDGCIQIGDWNCYI